MSQVVKVKFLSTLDQRQAKAYDFVVEDKDVVRGDIVLVKTQYGMTIAQVTQINATSDLDERYLSPILDVITSASDHFKSLTNRIVIEDKKKELAKRIAKVDEAQKMAAYIAIDSTIGDLMKEIEELDE